MPSQNDVSSDNVGDRSRDPSHQPIEENSFFAEISSDSGRIPGHSSIAAIQNDEKPYMSLEKQMIETVSSLAKAINEMLDFFDKLKFFEASNRHVAEELLSEQCHDRAELKLLVANSEKFILEQLECLKNGTPLLAISPPWSSSNTLQ